MSGDEDDDGNAASQVKSRSTPSKGVTAPPKPPGGATNPSIEEQVKAAPHLGALQSLYESHKDKIEAMAEADKTKIISVFTKRKAQLSGKD